MKQDKWTERLEKHSIVLYRCVVGWLLPYL